MTIRNVRGEGGVLPDPEDVGEGKPVALKGKDPVDDIETAYYRGRRVRAFTAGAGIEDRGTSVANVPKTEEKTSLNVGDIFKAQSDNFNTLLTQLTQMITTNSSNAQAAELTKIREEVKEARNALSGNDPMKAITDALAFQDTLAERIKKTLQPEKPVAPAGVLSAEAQVHLKKLDLELETMRQQHEERMAALRHQWEIEGRQWEKTYQLEVMKYNAEGGRKSDLMETIGQGIAAFVDGKRGAVGAAESVATKPVRASTPPPQAPPKSIVCDTEDCGTVIKIPDGATSAECPNCHAIYGPTTEQIPAVA